MCSQVTKDCQEKPEPNTHTHKKRERGEKKDEERSKSVISYLRKWREREGEEKNRKG